MCVYFAGIHRGRRPWLTWVATTRCCVAAFQSRHQFSHPSLCYDLQYALIISFSSHSIFPVCFSGLICFCPCPSSRFLLHLLGLGAAKFVQIVQTFVSQPHLPQAATIPHKFQKGQIRRDKLILYTLPHFACWFQLGGRKFRTYDCIRQWFEGLGAQSCMNLTSHGSRQGAVRFYIIEVDISIRYYPVPSNSVCACPCLNRSVHLALVRTSQGSRRGTSLRNTEQQLMAVIMLAHVALTPVCSEIV